MRLFSQLWQDEYGVLLSAEAVIVGTVAVVGLTTGLTVVAKSLNAELQDMAFAIRSLDQSYTIPAQECCGAWTAGSSFTQEPVQESLAALREAVKKSEKEEKSQAQRLEEKMKSQKQNTDEPKKKKERNI